MNIILSPSITINTYGLGISVFQTFQALIEYKYKVKLITSDQGFNEKSHKFLTKNIIYAKSILPYPYSHSYKIDNLLLKNNSSLIDLQGLWTPYSLITLNFYMKKKIPYIITTHGMLDNYANSSSNLKKRLALLLYESKCLKHAKAFRVTSKRELINLRKFGIKQPIAVIPHGIDNKLNYNYGNIKSKINSKTIIYVGRLHPIKNIESLLKAWSLINKEFANWKLIIAGVGEKKYTQKLFKYSEKLEISNLEWIGYVNNQEKNILIKNASALILPSLSENYGLVIAESLSLGTPVIFSNQTPWQQLERFNCGLCTSIDPESISLNIKKFIKFDFKKKYEMTIRSLEYANLNLSWDHIACEINQFYEWVKSMKKEKPSSVNII